MCLKTCTARSSSYFWHLLGSLTVWMGELQLARFFTTIRSMSQYHAATSMHVGLDCSFGHDQVFQTHMNELNFGGMHGCLPSVMCCICAARSVMRVCFPPVSRAEIRVQMHTSCYVLRLPHGKRRIAAHQFLKVVDCAWPHPLAPIDLPSGGIGGGVEAAALARRPVTPRRVQP